MGVRNSTAGGQRRGCTRPVDRRPARHRVPGRCDCRSWPAKPQLHRVRSEAVSGRPCLDPKRASPELPGCEERLLDPRSSHLPEAGDRPDPARELYPSPVVFAVREFTRAPGAPSRRWDRAPDSAHPRGPAPRQSPARLRGPSWCPPKNYSLGKEGAAGCRFRRARSSGRRRAKTERRRPLPSSPAVVCRPSPSQHTLAPNLRLPPRKRPVPPPWHGSRNDYPGDVLLSQGAAPQVPSALVVLTSVFGMGTGVAPPLWSPGTLLYLS